MKFIKSSEGKNTSPLGGGITETRMGVQIHSRIVRWKRVPIWILPIFTLFVSSCQTSLSPSFTQGNKQAKDGLIREAIESYKEALNQDPKNPDLHKNLGVTFLKSGEYRSCLKHLKKAYPYFRESFEVNFYLGECFRSVDNYQKSITYYLKSLQIKPDEPHALKAISWSYFSIQNYNEALMRSEKAYKLTPNDQQLPIIIARVLIKLRRFNEAWELVDRNLDSASPGLKPYLLSLEGEVMYATGNYEKAFKFYQEALKDKPFISGALLGLGKFYLKYSRSKEAAKYIEHAIRVKPKQWESYFLLAQAYEQSDPKKSLKLYKFFLSKISSDPELYSLLTEVKGKISKLSFRNKN